MVCIHERSRDTGFVQYFDAVDYLHFVRISDAKVIASRFPAIVLNVRNDGFASTIPNEEETGLNTVLQFLGPSKIVFDMLVFLLRSPLCEGKRTYQIQSYVIFWHFRLTLSVLNCDVSVFTG